MTLVLIIDLVVVGMLCRCALTKGFEKTLPLAAFLIVLFPFESQIVLPGLFDFTTQRVIIITLATLYLAFGRKSKAPPLPLKWLVLLLMAWMLLSALHSVVPIVSIKTVLSQFFDFFIPYYVFAKSISKSKSVNRILLGFVLGMFVCCLFGVVEAYWNWSILSIFPTAQHTFSSLAAAGDRDSRVQSSFGHAILFGGALAMTLPMALYLIVSAKSATRKVLLWGGIMLMFVCLFKTMSRGPWIAAVMSLALLLLGGERHLRKYVAVIGILTALTFVIRPGVWESISNLYGETLNPETAQGASYEWRYALYHVAFEHLNTDFERAVWGYGPESFVYLGWKGEFQGDVVPFDSCDSSVAALMIETGYVGLLVASVLFLAVAYCGLRNSIKLPRPRNVVSLVLFSALLSFYFLMTNVAILGWGQQSYIFWIVLALTVSYPAVVRREQFRADRHSGVWEKPSVARFPRYAEWV